MGPFPNEAGEFVPEQVGTHGKRTLTVAGLPAGTGRRGLVVGRRRAVELAGIAAGLRQEMRIDVRAEVYPKLAIRVKTSADEI